jgi:hypothetical protein
MFLPGFIDLTLTYRAIEVLWPSSSKKARLKLTGIQKSTRGTAGTRFTTEKLLEGGNIVCIPKSALLYYGIHSFQVGKTGNYAEQGRFCRCPQPIWLWSYPASSHFVLLQSVAARASEGAME